MAVIEGLPTRARCYVACVALGGLLCLSSSQGPVPASAVGLLAVLYAGGERIARRRFAGTCCAALLGAAFLLPPGAAALVPIPGALLSPVERGPFLSRRIWRAAQSTLVVWAAARAYGTLGGPSAVTAPDLPYTLVPAGAAVVVFCATHAVLDAGMFRLAEGLPARKVCRALFLRSLAPLTVHGLAGLMTAVLWRSPYGPVAALLVLFPIGVSWWVFAQYHHERAAHRATIRALVQAVDIKDGYTRGHSERVGRASMLIARELGMDERRVEVLRLAGILHDVGKLGVPTRLLRKDGPLTPEERRVIELHPEYGHEITRGISFLGEARSAILHHHERIDGSGYPYGLAGAQIPEPARVVAVADAFDAMTSTRSYRRARPVPAALEELRRCAGRQFDPAMVAALTRVIGREGWHPVVTADENRPRPDRPPPPAPAAPVRLPASDVPVPLAAPHAPVRLPVPDVPVRLPVPDVPVPLAAPHASVRVSASDVPVRLPVPDPPVRLSASDVPVPLAAPGPPVRLPASDVPVRLPAPGPPVRLPASDVPVPLAVSDPPVPAPAPAPALALPAPNAATPPSLSAPE